MNALKMVTLLAALLHASWALSQDEDVSSSDGGREQVIEVSKVPDFVMSSFKAEVPGAFVMRVMLQVLDDDTTRYRFDASQVGRYWVVVVRDDGELIEKYESAGPPRLG